MYWEHGTGLCKDSLDIPNLSLLASNSTSGTNRPIENSTYRAPNPFLVKSFECSDSTFPFLFLRLFPLVAIALLKQLPVLILLNLRALAYITLHHLLIHALFEPGFEILLSHANPEILDNYLARLDMYP